MGSKLRYRLTLLVIMTCFGLWGMGHAVSEPMSHTVAHVLKTKDEASVNATMTWAIHVAYSLFAIPAMLFVRRYGFNSGIFVGLMFFACGALSFLPASQIALLEPYVICYAALAAGVLFLEVSATPYAMTYGKRRFSLFRLCAAQTINVVGWLSGLALTGPFIRFCEIDVKQAPITVERLTVEAAQRDDLLTLTTPGTIAGVIALILAATIGVVDYYNMPGDGKPTDTGLRAIARRLFKSKAYVFGIITLFAYIMAQSLCWSSIMNYKFGTMIGFEAEWTSRADANCISHQFLTLGVASFGLGRLILAIASYKMIKRPAIVLSACAFAACGFTMAELFTENIVGLACLILASCCMSVMQPIIYYVSTRQLDVSATQVGTAGHAYAIFGGFAATYITYDRDGGHTIHIAVTAILFVIVAAYGIWSNRHRLH